MTRKNMETERERRRMRGTDILIELSNSFGLSFDNNMMRAKIYRLSEYGCRSFRPLTLSVFVCVCKLCVLLISRLLWVGFNWNLAEVLEDKLIDCIKYHKNQFNADTFPNLLYHYLVPVAEHRSVMIETERQRIVMRMNLLYWKKIKLR